MWQERIQNTFYTDFPSLWPSDSGPPAIRISSNIGYWGQREGWCSCASSRTNFHPRRDFTQFWQLTSSPSRTLEPRQWWTVTGRVSNDALLWILSYFYWNLMSLRENTLACFFSQCATLNVSLGSAFPKYRLIVQILKCLLGVLGTNVSFRDQDSYKSTGTGSQKDSLVALSLQESW